MQHDVARARGRGWAAAWLLCVALAGTLAADGFVVWHIRGEQEQAALDALRADRSRWVAAVREIAVRAQSARAPIADAQHLVLLDLGPVVRYDVYVRGAAAADFSALHEELSVVRPAADAHGPHQELLTALEGMTAAVRALADDKDDDVEDESRAFSSAAATWDGLVAAHIARDLPLATTDRADLPLTGAGRIFRWSTACAEGLLDDERLGDPGTDRLETARVFEGYALNLAVTLDRLLAVPVVPAELPNYREIDPAVRGLRPAVAALTEFARAIREQDRKAVEDALLELDQLDALFEAAARAFQVAGSTVCSDFFDPGLAGEGAAPTEDAIQT